MAQLGSLERAVMDVLWGASAAMSVHDIVDALADRDLAYTTVLTVVTNLHKKGFAGREKISRAYRYFPLQSREEATSQTLRQVLDASGDSTAVLMHFARMVTPEEREVLSEHLSRTRADRPRKR
ncbi:BlaI/MecI/CopY family transcriptional regulator [Gordonia sp. Swx-4]|uniref:BlaI/MecI/CopY family transcriptional regulator n=1 Tax=Gordonia TaxID=2053 RepID=UPI0022A694AE|nr:MULTISPECIES: BlaI/MecI/CopY family transcriptional regulator [Gordonia]MCZ0914048.1 BlaI/MecI/CopY family transcriptional regulator [Gordonia amicalis]WJG15531.1 BlaI/MecI/CopY family transcriptional regulator [Gordonia sp. Swx-4]